MPVNLTKCERDRAEDGAHREGERMVLTPLPARVRSPGQRISKLPIEQPTAPLGGEPVRVHADGDRSEPES